MKAKTARRFFSRNLYKIAKKKIDSKKLLFCYFRRKEYKKYLTALRKDQINPASQRIYQRALFILS